MRSNYKRIGDYIELVDQRNKELNVNLLLGLSISKQFIPSVANTIGANMMNYKIIKKGQFACSIMQVRRDGKMPVALLQDFDEAIISQAYPVFKVVDELELLPEYLMMWFSRGEFDRQATFHAVGGVRGSLDWDDFLDFELPIPSLEKQQEIVNEYNNITNRIDLNEQINKKIEETAQVLHKHWFVDFDFPDENGNPYKSSGGEMVYNDEMESELPKNWQYNNLGDNSTIKAGGDKPKTFLDYESDLCNIPVYSNSSKNRGLFGFTNKATVFDKSITISARGAIIGYTELRTKPFVPIVRLIVVIPKQDYQLNYLFYCIKKFRFDDLSSAQGQLTIPDISSYKVIVPKPEILKKYQKTNNEIFKYKDIIKGEIQKLSELENLLLSKMTKVEVGDKMFNV